MTKSDNPLCRLPDSTLYYEVLPSSLCDEEDDIDLDDEPEEEEVLALDNEMAYTDDIPGAYEAMAELMAEAA